MAWHERLGHLNWASMKQLVKAKLLPGLSRDGFVPTFCDDCASGKLQIAKFTSHSTSKSLVCLGRVSSDIAGPFFKSSAKSCYYQVFVDEYSGMRWIYTMSNKNGETIMNNVKQFVADVGLPRSFRLDNDATFTSHAFRGYAREHGIRLEFCQSHRHAQNGLAERTISSINVMTRVLLSSSGLTSHYWPYAARYAAWLQNRLPSRGSLQSPLTLFNKKLPDVSAFRVFGATSYALDGQHPAGKLSPQAVRCKFIGYSIESGKPSAILLTASGRIFTSRDVAVNADSI